MLSILRIGFGATKLVLWRLRRFAARIIGHRQISDAYLLGLAVHNKGKLLALDRGMRSLAGAAMIERGMVEIL